MNSQEQMGSLFRYPAQKLTSNSIESTVNRKPTHTYSYLDYSSNNPILTKLSVIHHLIHRAKQVCYTPEFPAKEMDHLYKVLQDNDYPVQSFQQANPNRKPNPSTGKFTQGARFVITYIKSLSEQYRHTLAKLKSQSFLERDQHHQVFTHASKRSKSRCSEN